MTIRKPYCADKFLRWDEIIPTVEAAGLKFSEIYDRNVKPGWDAISTAFELPTYYPDIANPAPDLDVLWHYQAYNFGDATNRLGKTPEGILFKKWDDLFYKDIRNEINDQEVLLEKSGSELERSLELWISSISAGTATATVPPQLALDIQTLRTVIQEYKEGTWRGEPDGTYLSTLESELVNNNLNTVPVYDYGGGYQVGFPKQIQNLLLQSLAIKNTYNNAKNTLESEWGCPPDLNIENYIKDELAKLSVVKINNDKTSAISTTFAAGWASLDRKARLDAAIAAGKKAAADAFAAAKAAADAAFASQQIFREQCFILGNLIDLVEARKSGVSIQLPYAPTAAGSADPSNTAINIQGSPFAFVNKLAVSPDQKFLFELKNEELSSITPSMRFFKVDSDPTDGKDLSTEITFDTNVANDLSKYMSRTSTKKQGGRGLGVGVKSFDFSYEGTDPFSAKKAIKAKLVLYAPNFSDLLRERVGEKGRKYSYVDLALKTGKYRGKEADEAAKRAAEGKAFNIERENLDKLNFRLRAEVLWTANKDSLRLFDSQGKKDAIYNSAISFYLTPTIHEFDFDETGAVTFTINYLAYIEDYFAQPQFDIFGNLGTEKRYRDLIFDYFRKADCDVDGYSEFKEIDAQFISLLNRNSLNAIVRKLREQQLIYYIDVSKEEMSDWLDFPVSADFSSRVSTEPKISVTDAMVNDAVNKAKSSAKTSPDKINLDAYRLSLVANSDLRENIAFFYLSDLIDIVMSLVESGLKTRDTSRYYDHVFKSNFTNKEDVRDYIEENLGEDREPKIQATIEQFKKMRIVLGPMEVAPYTTKRQKQKMYSCTLGDLPISMNYFLDFMSEKVLSNDFISYPLSKFIKDVINDCIKNFLNSDGCFNSDSSQRVSLNSTTVLAYNTSTGPADDDLSNLIVEGNGGKWSTRGCLLLNKVPESKFPILKISGPNDQRTNLDISTMRNYYIFSIARRYPTDLYNGKADIDAKSGIFHYTLGADKGIVKNISLDKTNTPGLKELRFEQEGFDGLTQLREVYNANITTFLNPQTFPGTYIYVEPRGFDPTASEDLSKFGIGGYYMITKTAHSIQPGNAETTINAAWVADKGGTVVKNEGDDSDTKIEDNKKILKCRVQAVQNAGRN